MCTTFQNTPTYVRISKILGNLLLGGQHTNYTVKPTNVYVHMYIRMYVDMCHGEGAKVGWMTEYHGLTSMM